MGEKNSTKTRIVPVFNRLFDKDASGKKWLGKLLRLPELGEAKLKTEIPKPSKIINHAWGNNEAKLHPPRSLLKWLVENLSEPNAKNAWDTSLDTQKKRKDLINKDKTVIKEAINLLSGKEIPRSGWYILEGYTQPDVYIETENEIIVIEGKRTELNFTENTTWMGTRYQMLRHLDCTWDIREDKNIYGFFIVEQDKHAVVPPSLIRNATRMIRPEVLAKNLPHRSLDEQSTIAKCFLGITTWQDVCYEFDIDFTQLPNII